MKLFQHLLKLAPFPFQNSPSNINTASSPTNSPQIPLSSVPLVIMTEKGREWRDLEQSLDSLVTAVRSTHRQFEVLLANTNLPDSTGSCGSRTNTDTSESTEKITAKRILGDRTASAPRPGREGASMIIAGLLYVKPVTTPVPFRLQTKERAENKSTGRGMRPPRPLMRNVSSRQVLAAAPQGCFSHLSQRAKRSL